MLLFLALAVILSSHVLVYGQEKDVLPSPAVTITLNNSASLNWQNNEGAVSYTVYALDRNLQLHANNQTNNPNRTEIIASINTEDLEFDLTKFAPYYLEKGTLSVEIKAEGLTTAAIDHELIEIVYRQLADSELPTAYATLRGGGFQNQF